MISEQRLKVDILVILVWTPIVMIESIMMSNREQKEGVMMRGKK